MFLTEYTYTTGFVVFVVATLVALFVLFKLVDMDGGL